MDLVQIPGKDKVVRRNRETPGVFTGVRDVGSAGESDHSLRT